MYDDLGCCSSRLRVALAAAERRMEQYRQDWYQTTQALEQSERRVEEKEQERIEAVAHFHGMQTRALDAEVALARVREALTALEKRLRTSSFRGGGGLRRHSCSSCGLTEEEQAEVDGFNRALSLAADEIRAALGSGRAETTEET